MALLFKLYDEEFLPILYHCIMKGKLIIAIILIHLTTKSQVLETMNHGGIVRTYTYYKPSSWTFASQLPLLIVLHGLTQTGGGVMDITQFNQIAESNNFIVCYPSGINNAWNANMNVNVSNADDKGFLESLIVYFQQNFNINPNRQYLCGFSNGAFMSHKLACESELCFAGIATVSGTMSDTIYSTCSPSKATSILHIHGTADAVVPYNGSPSTGVSVEQTIEKWRSYLNCSLNPSSIDLPNTNLLDLSSAQRLTYSNCNGSTLEHIKVIGGGHQWPGISTWNGGIGAINMDFYSPEIIWDFLETRQCVNQLSIEEEELKEFDIYPNPSEGQINFEYTNIHSLKIFSIDGQMQFQTHEINSSGINLNLPDGIYNIQLITKTGKEFWKKVIIDKF
jgi:polyhydroxybutyrate depolymerase